MSGKQNIGYCKQKWPGISDVWKTKGQALVRHTNPIFVDSNDDDDSDDNEDDEDGDDDDDDNDNDDDDDGDAQKGVMVRRSVHY